MSNEQSIEEEIALVLHAADCGCNEGEPHDEPYATQAAALAPLLNRVRAEALREAADQLNHQMRRGMVDPVKYLELHAVRIEQNSEGNEA